MKPQAFLLLILGCLIAFAVVVRYGMPASTDATPVVETVQTSKKEEINPDLPPQAGAVLTHADGVTLVRKEVRTEAREEMELKSGDTIEVADDGSAVIIWPHYGRTIVAGSSSLKIEKAFESVNRLRFEVRLSLDRGRIWNRFIDVLSQAQYFHIRAGDILIEAPGGSFGVRRDAEGEVAIDVRSEAVRAARVLEELPTGDMRKAGFDKAVVEKPVGEIVTISAGARRISPGGAFVATDSSSDAFAESGDEVPSPAELDVAPTDATMTADSSL